MDEIDFTSFYSGVRAFGFIEDLLYFQSESDLKQAITANQFSGVEMERACLHESMAFLSAALANLLASNHEKSGGYSTWSRISEYYSYYYVQIGLLRLAGGGPSTACVRDEGSYRPIWFWRVSNTEPKYHIGRWGDLRRTLGITGRNPLSGIHGKVAQMYNHVFCQWSDGPLIFGTEPDDTLRILRQPPPFPYEYPIELRIEYNYTPRRLIDEVFHIDNALEAKRLAELGPQNWDQDPEEWWFSLTVWEMVKYGLRKLYQAGHERSKEYLLSYVRTHDAHPRLREEVIGFIESLN